MDTKKPLADEQLEQVTGGTDPTGEEYDQHPEISRPGMARCPYCNQMVSETWWDEHMIRNHPDMPMVWPQ